METDLHSAIRAKILQPIHQKYIIYQLIKCLKYMHSAKLLHRDMKPSNLLLNSDCEVKICDFGLARIIDENSEGTSPSQQVLTDYVATRWYRAPEILLGSNYYTFGVDLWAVGCILGEMLLGNPMFPGTSTMDQLQQNLKITGYPTPKEINAINSPFATTMLTNCKKLIKKKPITKLYPKLSADAADLLENLLQFNPEKRLTANEAIKHAYVSDFHDPSNEPEAKSSIKIKFDDNTQLSVNAYRDELYRMIQSKKRNDTKKYKRRHHSSHHSQYHSSVLNSSSSTSNMTSSSNNYSMTRSRSQYLTRSNHHRRRSRNEGLSRTQSRANFRRK